MKQASIVFFIIAGVMFLAGIINSIVVIGEFSYSPTYIFNPTLATGWFLLSILFGIPGFILFSSDKIINVITNYFQTLFNHSNVKNNNNNSASNEKTNITNHFKPLYNHSNVNNNNNSASNEKNNIINAQKMSFETYLTHISNLVEEKFENRSLVKIELAFIIYNLYKKKYYYSLSYNKIIENQRNFIKTIQSEIDEKISYTEILNFYEKREMFYADFRKHCKTNEEFLFTVSKYLNALLIIEESQNNLFEGDLNNTPEDLLENIKEVRFTNQIEAILPSLTKGLL